MTDQTRMEIERAIRQIERSGSESRFMILCRICQPGDKSGEAYLGQIVTHLQQALYNVPISLSDDTLGKIRAAVVRVCEEFLSEARV